MSLRGESNWTPPSSDRVPIEVHPEVVAELRDLLFEDDMRGVGYSEFIHRAVAAARDEHMVPLAEVAGAIRDFGRGHRTGKEHHYIYVLHEPEDYIAELRRRFGGGER